MSIINLRNRKHLVFMAAAAVFVCVSFCFAGVYRVRALENNCTSLGISILPSYINIENFLPGTAINRSVRLRRGCASEEYMVGIEAGDDPVAPWLFFEPHGNFLFKPGREDEYIDALISVPFNTEAGSYEGSLTFKLLPRHGASEGVTINTNIGIRASIKINVIPRDEAIFEGSLGIAVRDENMFDRLRGRILINVDKAGRAYYINPQRPVMYYLGRPGDAIRVMREQGEGITNADLYKISEGEIEEGDEIIIDLTPVDIFAKHNAGRIFIQTEDNGEAWYVDPESYRRYYLGRPDDAFRIMRELGLGINEEDFKLLTN